MKSENYKYADVNYDNFTNNKECLKGNKNLFDDSRNHLSPHSLHNHDKKKIVLPNNFNGKQQGQELKRHQRKAEEFDNTRHNTQYKEIKSNDNTNGETKAKEQEQILFNSNNFFV